MTRLPRLGLILALALSAAGGCGPDPPRGPTAPVTPVPAPADIQATLLWMTERTMLCAELSRVAGTRRWRCTGTSVWPDGSVDTLAVGIQRDDDGATHLTATVDARETVNKELCSGLVCDGYTGFFSDTVAMAPITAAQGRAIAAWIEEQPRAVRNRQFGPIKVDYRPALPILMMIMDINGLP